jgi:hypothetical protein
LYCNLLINQPSARQPAKILHKRRTQLLLDIDVHRVSKPPGHRVVSDFLACLYVHCLAGFIQVHARASFKHGKLDDPVRMNISQNGCAGYRRSHGAHLDLCAAGFLGHIKQKLSAAQLDGPGALADCENGFLAQARDRLVLERQLTSGLRTGLHGRPLMNSLVYRCRTCRCARWHNFDVLHNLRDPRLREIEGTHLAWQPTHQGELNRRDD